VEKCHCCPIYVIVKKEPSYFDQLRYSKKTVDCYLSILLPFDMEEIQELWKNKSPINGKENSFTDYNRNRKNTAGNLSGIRIGETNI